MRRHRGWQGTDGGLVTRKELEEQIAPLLAAGNPWAGLMMLRLLKGDDPDLIVSDLSAALSPIVKAFGEIADYLVVSAFANLN